MLDTLKLSSPFISEAVARAVELACVRRSEVVCSTEFTNWEIFTAQPEGSYEHRVSVRVERQAWVNIKHAYKVPCEPFITVEGSVHKALLGHNVYGGPLSFVQSARWFIDHVAALLGVSLPDAETWELQRADVAEAYELPSFAACEDYIYGLNQARFPRRKPLRYGNETIMFPGTTTSIKAYHKGPELWRHDRQRLRKYMSDSALLELQERANCILRLETSIKAKKLTADFKGKPKVVQVTQAYLERVHDKEMARLLREASSDVEIVRTYQEVSRRLKEKHEERLSSILFATWTGLSVLGEEEVKKSMNSATWYRQRKQLTEAGVSWHGTDVRIEERCSAIPAGFSPIRSDTRRLTDEADEVIKQLYSYNRPVPKEIFMD